MELNPKTTDKLLGMINSKDAESRALAYAMLSEFLNNDYFIVKKNIGYLLSILKLDQKQFLNEGIDSTDRKVIIKAINNFRLGTGNRKIDDDYDTDFLTYKEIVNLTVIYVPQPDFEQRHYVLKTVIKSMENLLGVKYKDYDR
jgi:hypothetical protein